MPVTYTSRQRHDSREIVPPLASLQPRPRESPLPLLRIHDTLSFIADLGLRILSLKHDALVRRASTDRTQNLLPAKRAHVGDTVHALGILNLLLLFTILAHENVLPGRLAVEAVVLPDVAVGGVVTYSGVLRDVLHVAGGLGDGFLERVAVDAAGTGVLGVVAGAAGEEEGVGGAVFLGVEHVGAGHQISE